MYTPFGHVYCALYEDVGTFHRTRCGVLLQLCCKKNMMLAIQQTENTCMHPNSASQINNRYYSFYTFSLHNTTLHVLSCKVVVLSEIYDPSDQPASNIICCGYVMYIFVFKHACRLFWSEGNEV